MMGKKIIFILEGKCSGYNIEMNSTIIDWSDSSVCHSEVSE